MKLLHLDIETSYLIGAVWGMWDQNVAEVIQDPYILGFGYSWNHLKEVKWVGMIDFPSHYKRDHTSDKQVVIALHKLLDEADVVVAHNGVSFDVKKIKGRFLVHGMKPPAPFSVVDTKTVAKQFGFASNKLDELGRVLLGERKVKHEGISLWTRCMSRKIDPDAWKKMGDYCIQDVILLKKLYNTMLPWVKNHPNWNIYEETVNGCPHCGSSQIQHRGSAYTKTSENKRYSCNKCGAWFRGKSVRRVDLR